MAETVKVPGIKKPLPKWGVAAGIGGTAVAVYLYYRNKKAGSTAAAAAAPTTTDQYPPDGTVGNPSDPYSTDPATGQTYGDEAAGQGTYGAFGTGGTGGGSGWNSQTGLYTDPNGNTCTNPGPDGYCPGSGSGGPPFSNNSAWSNYVLTQIPTINPNVNLGALTDALGLYLAGQPVDPAQKTLIFDALAIGGDPPVAGPNGYPPKVQGNGGKGGHPGGYATNPPPGFKLASLHTPAATFTWDKGSSASAGVKSYEFSIYDGGALVDSRPGLGGTSSSVSTNVLKKGRHYAAYLRALPEAPGATKAEVDFST